SLHATWVVAVEQRQRAPQRSVDASGWRVTERHAVDERKHLFWRRLPEHQAHQPGERARHALPQPFAPEVLQFVETSQPREQPICITGSSSVSTLALGDLAQHLGVLSAGIGTQREFVGSTFQLGYRE